MNKRIFYFFVLSILVIFSSIASDAQSRSNRSRAKRPVAKKPAPPSAGAVKTSTGLIYLITHKGTGAQAKSGDTVSVHYTGTLTDGTKFDSSRDRGRPIEFALGAGKVIKGWDEGIAKLHVGDQAIFVIPPEIAYGVKGKGPIPPNATLIFIVELVDTKTPEPPANSGTVPPPKQ